MNAFQGRLFENVRHFEQYCAPLSVCDDCFLQQFLDQREYKCVFFNIYINSWLTPFVLPGDKFFFFFFFFILNFLILNTSNREQRAGQ